jgi:hypothetical protein
MPLSDRDGEIVHVGPFDDDRYVVHDYLKFQDSAEKIERNRAWDARRKELERDRDLVAAIKERDRDRCRYCGALVNWRDRRGPKGGTYDHVQPRGDNSLNNVVVACRRCNCAKGGRTPEEAGMPLLPPGGLGLNGAEPDRGQVPARSRPGSGQKDQPHPNPYPNPNPQRGEAHASPLSESEEPGLRERIEQVVAILGQCRRLHIDQVGVENAVAAWPHGDAVRAARTIVTWATDPAFRSTNAARLLDQALSKQQQDAARAAPRPVEHPADKQDRELADLARELEERDAA